VKALQDEAMAVALENAPVVKSRKVLVAEDNGKKRKAVAKGSMGVEKLKKANINGMSKISSFFQKN